LIKFLDTGFRRYDKKVDFSNLFNPQNNMVSYLSKDNFTPSTEIASPSARNDNCKASLLGVSVASDVEQI